MKTLSNEYRCHALNGQMRIEIPVTCSFVACVQRYVEPCLYYEGHPVTVARIRLPRPITFVYCSIRHTHARTHALTLNHVISWRSIVHSIMPSSAVIGFTALQIETIRRRRRRRRRSPGRWLSDERQWMHDVFEVMWT